MGERQAWRLTVAQVRARHGVDDLRAHAAHQHRARLVGKVVRGLPLDDGAGDGRVEGGPTRPRVAEWPSPSRCSPRATAAAGRSGSTRSWPSRRRWSSGLWRSGRRLGVRRAHQSFGAGDEVGHREEPHVHVQQAVVTR